VVDVKGKPNDHGLRCFVHVVRLSCTCLPVPIRIMPELCRPIYSASQILDTFTLQTYEAPMSVTADAYFASIDWLAAHPSIISYHALKLPKFPFLPLLYYNLPVRCCRIFRRAGICVSVWHDDTARKHETTLRACATNAYPGSAFHSAPPSLLPCLGSSFAVGPRYPPTFLPALEDATTEHLKQLAQSVGVTTGGTKSELAHRICGFPPPRSSLTLPPSHSSSSASAFNSSLTRKQLQTELIKRGKHSTGSKQELQHRLEIVDASFSDADAAQSQLRDFLGGNDYLPPNTLPVINGFYSSTFNLLDRFDHVASATQYQPRIDSEFNRVFISLVHMAATTVYHVCRDNAHRDPTYPACPLSCRSFTRFLALSLIDSKKALDEFA